MENQIVITANGLLWLLGAVITIGGATAVISRWLAPIRTLKEDVKNKVNQTDFESLKKEVSELKGYQNSDHNELKKIEVGIEKTCKCVLAITDHELTGNSVARLKEAKNEMEDYLIQK